MNKNDVTVNSLTDVIADATDFFFFDRPEWGDEVVRNKDQSVVQPMKINEPLAWYHLSLWFPSKF